MDKGRSSLVARQTYRDAQGLIGIRSSIEFMGQHRHH